MNLEREALFDAYLVGSLTLSDAEKLKELLANNEEARAEFVRYVSETSLFIRVGTQIQTQRLPSISAGEEDGGSGHRRALSRIKSLSLWLALAACICVFVGLKLVIFDYKSPAPIATLLEKRGDVSVERNHAVQPAEQGQRLEASDIVLVGRGAATVIQYADATRLEIGAGSQVRLEGKAEGTRQKDDVRTAAKSVWLHQGTLVADVAKQPAGHPMVFKTSTAEATVVGTRLHLRASDTSTQLEVEEGAVRLRRLADDQAVVVSKGEQAMAGRETAPLVVTPTSSTVAQGATYYISPTGKDTNPGTIALPFATLQKAHDIAVAGDIIYMRGGVYLFAAPTIFNGRNGSSGNLIKVFNYPGEIPVIDATNQPDGSYPIRFNGASWWHIKGLEIKNGKEGGIVLSTTPPGVSNDNNIIENCNIHHNGATARNGGVGIAVRGRSANNLILNNDSHHNKDASRADADGIQIFTSGTGNIVRGNRAWRNSDDGIDVWNSIGVVVENNWVFENGFDDNMEPSRSGMGFRLGGSTSGFGGHTVKNNVAWKNKTFGFTYNSADVPSTLYHNTAWNNGDGNYFFPNAQDILRNNISFGTLGATSASTTFNSWTLSVTVDDADFYSLDDSIARGPRNAYGSLPTSDFLKLVAGSDLIDMGADVGIPYSGRAPDLGAFEDGIPEKSPSLPPISSKQTRTP